MRRCLLLSSLLLLVAVAMRAEGWLLPLSGRQQYGVVIEARGAELTGVCIVKTDDEGSRGAIVNEFGFHALDFTLSADRRKVKLLNVMDRLDRWYIRKVVRKDLRMLWGATQSGPQKSRRTITVDADGTVVLTNQKYKLKYSLKRIDDTAK